MFMLLLMRVSNKRGAVRCDSMEEKKTSVWCLKYAITLIYCIPSLIEALVDS